MTKQPLLDAECGCNMRAPRSAPLPTIFADMAAGLCALFVQADSTCKTNANRELLASPMEEVRLFMCGCFGQIVVHVLQRVLLDNVSGEWWARLQVEIGLATMHLEPQNTLKCMCLFVE